MDIRQYETKLKDAFLNLSTAIGCVGNIIYIVSNADTYNVNRESENNAE